MMNWLSEKSDYSKEFGQIRLLGQDEYGLKQTKGGWLARAVMGPRNDLRWPRKLHDIGTLRAGMLVLRGCLLKWTKEKKMNLLYFIIQRFWMKDELVLFIVQRLWLHDLHSVAYVVVIGYLASISDPRCGCCFQVLAFRSRQRSS